MGNSASIAREFGNNTLRLVFDSRFFNYFVYMIAP